TGKPATSLRILTQNENGPCPLIALANVLILRGDVELGIPPSRSSISNDEITAVLANHILNQHHQSKSATDEDIDALLRMLPMLGEGLDVDIKFSSNFGFDVSSPASKLFNAFKVDLVHGWVVDSNNERELAHILKKRCRDTYEGAVEFVLGCDAASQGLVVEAQQGGQVGGKIQTGGNDEASPLDEETLREGKKAERASEMKVRGVASER
ncbi:hypothetical protein EV182_001170, partial [Spiromyces aspiralis]